MFPEELLLGSSDLKIQNVIVEAEVITLTINSIQVNLACPECHQEAQRVHSFYWRTPTDLPVVGLCVRLRLLVRRFFCDNVMCKRKTFAEQFLTLLPAYARRTERLAHQQRQVGLSVGGQGGARLLGSIAMPTSGDTVLRLVKDFVQQEPAVPQVLGIDDWAWSKGQRYGTILVDLEQHRVVDLLSDRSSETLAAWLEAHPGIKIISRDRAREYIKGIEQGASDAVQVADRWHLLRNLADALIRLLEQNRDCLVAAATQPVSEPIPESVAAISQAETIEDAHSLPKLEQKQQAAQERRLTRYQAVIELHQKGMKMRAIARQLGFSRATVRRYIKAGRFPDVSRRARRSSILDAYLPYLQQRWTEGCHNGLQLYREIEQKGYRGSRPTVSRWAAQMRKLHPSSKQSSETETRHKEAVTRPWSARYAAWLLLKPPEVLKPEKKAALERILDASPVLRPAYNFAQAFIRIIWNRYSKNLRPWLDAVRENQIPELTGFARSMEQDFDAVLAALMLPWSNGQVEGQVNRLKMIKRQMYGRAGFDLLRIRVMAH
jgi:transposase